MESTRFGKSLSYVEGLARVWSLTLNDQLLHISWEALGGGDLSLPLSCTGCCWLAASAQETYSPIAAQLPVREGVAV